MMKYCKKIKLYVIILTAFLTGFYNIFAQSVPLRIEINPLNRAMIYFSNEIPAFNSLLSKDKKQVIIKIPSKSKASNSLNKKSSGIIQYVGAEQTKDSIIIKVNFAEARGYNAYPLPYSNILVIEAFRWDELTKAEDFYRQGLLAYESRVYSEAQTFFNKSATLNQPNANFFAGLMSIMEEEFREAEGYLLKAENLKSNIPDLNAALSYIYDLKNDTKKTDIYKRKFKSLTGIATIKELQSDYFTPEEDNSDDEPLSLLDLPFSDDSLKSDTSVTDTITKPSAVTEIKTSNDTLPVIIGGNENKDSLLPEWMNSFTFYAVGIGLVFVLLLVSSYVKWRNNKLKYLMMKEKKLKQQDAFKENLNKAKSSIKTTKEDDLTKFQPKSKAIQSQAVNTYKKTETESKDLIDDSKEIYPKESPKTQPVPEPKKEKVRESLEQQLEKLADKLEPEIKSSDISIIPEIAEQTSQDSDDKPQPQINPGFQLALHLHEEQEKLRNRNIENIDTGIIPDDVKKLAEFAKKLGIDKGSVETKKAISRLIDDKEKMENLYKKFAGDKKEGIE